MTVDALPGLPLAFQQLGNPKVEQLHLAVISDQYVRRLEVAVHDQVGVRLGYGPQHIEKQPNARFDIEPVLVAVAIDVIAFNVFENEIRLSSLRHSGIDQFRDVRMNQKGENAALAFESFLAALPHQRDVEELHRHLPLKSSVVSFRQPDAAHAALADLRDQCVDAKSLTRQARPVRQSRRSPFSRKPSSDSARCSWRELFQLLRQVWILRPQRGQPDRPFFVCHGERFVQVWTQGLPLIGTQCGHRFLRVANPRAVRRFR